jgi:thiamine pyrophosphate-dependent acetolactate synthase large subunit-like protein
MDQTRAQLARADVLKGVDATFPDAPLVLTLGGTAREMLAVAGRKPQQLVNLDAMGQTVSLGLGLALGLADHPAGDRVVVVEGDGSLLMGLSVVSTIGHLKPANLVCLVLDNGVYLATGGQPTASADMDFVAVSKASGWADGRDVRTVEELDDALKWSATAAGPILIRIYVNTDQLSTGFYLEDPAILAEDFRRWLATREGQGARHERAQRP